MLAKSYCARHFLPFFTKFKVNTRIAMLVNAGRPLVLVVQRPLP